eukprot:scaffold13964_cov117-Isochrysis_galbana.AAC.3
MKTGHAGAGAHSAHTAHCTRAAHSYTYQQRHWGKGSGARLAGPPKIPKFRPPKTINGAPTYSHRPLNKWCLSWADLQLSP